MRTLTGSIAVSKVYFSWSEKVRFLSAHGDFAPEVSALFGPLEIDRERLILNEHKCLYTCIHVTSLESLCLYGRQRVDDYVHVCAFSQISPHITTLYPKILPPLCKCPFRDSEIAEIQ